MEKSEEKYTTASRELLEKALDELAQGDLRQASEKGWGAAAQAVKAVAQRRSWRHDGHATLFEIVNRLMAETPDPQLGMGFHTTNNLHINFYENMMGKELVAVGLEQVQEFVQKMESFLE